MVNRANPADLRKALEMAQIMAKAGIMFVPMPAVNADDLNNLTDESALKFNLMLAEPPKGQPQRPADAAGLPLLYAKASQAPVTVPQGFKLVPVRMTKAMQEAVDDEGWQWEDLLAAAEVITEDEYAMLSKALQPLEQQAQASEGGAT